MILFGFDRNLHHQSISGLGPEMPISGYNHVKVKACVIAAFSK
jgi:hypothetical protein